MTRRCLTLCVLPVAVCASPVAAGAPAGTKHRPTLTYAPGKYVLNRLEKTSFSSAGKAAGIDARVERLMVLDMGLGKCDAKGVKRLVMSFRRFRLQTVSAGVKLTIDTDQPDDGVFGKFDPALGRNYRRLCAARLLADISPAGELTIVRGLDAFWDDQAARHPSEAQRLKGMKKGQGDPLFTTILATWGDYLPRKPVAVGERWTSEVAATLPYVGPVRLSQECWVHEVASGEGGKLLVIRFVRTTTEDKAATRKPDQPDLGFRDMSLRQTGSLQFNLDTNMPARLVINTKGRFVALPRRAGTARNVVQLTQRLEATIDPAPAQRAATQPRP